MKNNMFRKSFVSGLMVLIIGGSILPSTGSPEVEKYATPMHNEIPLDDIPILKWNGPHGSFEDYIESKEITPFSVQKIEDSRNAIHNPLIVVFINANLAPHIEDEIAVYNATLKNIGYDTVIGYLKTGIEAWYNAALPVEKFRLLTVHDLKQYLEKKDDFILLDVRGKNEWEKGHIENTRNIYYGRIKDELGELTTEKPIIVICGSGKRASFTASILRKSGFKDVYNVLGGMTAWEKAKYPTAAT